MALTRSQNMSRIRSSGTSPELVIRKGLTAAGLRYRLHARTPGGKADLSFISKRIAVFVDGCFWHGCPEHYVRPRTHREFWDRKLRENVERDRRQSSALEKAGWIGVRVWEHEVRETPDAVVQLVLDSLSSLKSSINDWRVVRVEVVDSSKELERRFLERIRSETDRVTEIRVRTTRKLGRVGAPKGRQSGPR